MYSNRSMGDFNQRVANSSTSSKWWWRLRRTYMSRFSQYKLCRGRFYFFCCCFIYDHVISSEQGSWCHQHPRPSKSANWCYSRWRQSRPKSSPSSVRKSSSWSMWSCGGSAGYTKPPRITWAIRVCVCEVMVATDKCHFKKRKKNISVLNHQIVSGPVVIKSWSCRNDKLSGK